MDVSGAKDRENQSIHMWKRHNGLNQQWDIVYVDESIMSLPHMNALVFSIFCSGDIHNFTFFIDDVIDLISEKLEPSNICFPNLEII
jgi:hypothetical protein